MGVKFWSRFDAKTGSVVSSKVILYAHVHEGKMVTLQWGEKSLSRGISIF